MIFHSGIDGTGTVDLFGENKAGQLVGHRDAAHAELERRRALDLVRKARGVLSMRPSPLISAELVSLKPQWRRFLCRSGWSW